MPDKKYAGLEALQIFLDNLRNIFASFTHKHTISDLEDYTVDTALSSTSTNAVQNKVVDAEFEAISEAMGVLEMTIDGKSDSSHVHDDRYYTETETDELIASHNHDSLYDSQGSADLALEAANTYTDNAVAQKAQVQLIFWGVDD